MVPEFETMVLFKTAIEQFHFENKRKYLFTSKNLKLGI